MRMCLIILIFLGCSRSVVSVKVRYSWIIEGLEHALIFKAFFPGCQHVVGERVSLRGAVIKFIGFRKNPF